MQSSRAEGINSFQSQTPSALVCAMNQHVRQTDESPQNNNIPSSYNNSSNMSTAVIQNCRLAGDSSRQFFSPNQSEETSTSENCADKVLLETTKTCKHEQNNLTENSSVCHSFEPGVVNNNICQNNEPRNNEFESECSNKVVHDQQAENRKYDLDRRLQSGNNNLVAFPPLIPNPNHAGSHGNERMLNKRQREENDVNGADVVLDTTANTSAATSADSSDVLSSHDVYDRNSWILYGDSQSSVNNNSCVTYSTNSLSVASQQTSTQAIETAEQPDAVLSGDVAVNADVTDDVEEIVADGGSDQTTRDKESSSYEDLFNESRPHACSVCSKRFKLSHHLKEHMRIHTGEKPFPCTVCGERFSRSHLLRAHQARHSQDSFPSIGTVFPCSKCMKIFESPQHLARHEKNHNQPAVHKCDVCEKQFTHPALLNRHKQQQHTTPSLDTDDSAGANSIDLRIKKEPDDNDVVNSDLPVDNTDERNQYLQCSEKPKGSVSLRSEQNILTKENQPVVDNLVTDDNEIQDTERKTPVLPEKKYDQSSWVLYGDAQNRETACTTVQPKQQMESLESEGNAFTSIYKGLDMAKLHELYLTTNRSVFNRNGLVSPFYGMLGFDRHTLMSLVDHSAMNSSDLSLPYYGGDNVKTESSPGDRSCPHHCPHCSKRFKLSHHLREHLRIHTGEKPYHCDVCHERFSRSHLLQRHKTKHISDMTFHQVTEWIQKTGAECESSASDVGDPLSLLHQQQARIRDHLNHSDGANCDGSTGGGNDVSDPITLLHQQQARMHGHLNNTNMSVDRLNNTVINSSNADDQNDFSHSKRNQDEDGLSESDSEHLSNCDDAHDQREEIENMESESYDTRCMQSTSVETALRLPRMNDMSNSIVGMSKVDHKTSSIMGFPGTFQKSKYIAGVSESNHGSNSSNLDSIANYKSDHLFTTSKMNLKSEPIDEVSRICHLSDSMPRPGPDYPYIQHSEIGNEIRTSMLPSQLSTQYTESSKQAKRDQNICENDDIEDNETSDEFAYKSKVEDYTRSVLKSRTDSPTIEMKYPGLAGTSFSSNLQLNGHLLNSSMSLFNTNYLNHTRNLQQAINANAFTSCHDNDSLPLDIPHGDFPQAAFLSSLEYSHFLRSRQGALMKCEFCGKWFADANNLRQHMVSHSLDRHFSCDLCEKKFKRPHHLKEHLRIHTGEKPYVCDVCDEKFSRSHILQRHRLKHDSPLMNETYVQNILHNICDQTRARSPPQFVYDKYSSQNVSVKGEPITPNIPAVSSDSDSDNKPASQSVAYGKQTDLADSDYRNVRKWNSVESEGFSHDVKSARQSFVCRECGKTFANSSNLKQHMVSHFPDRLFSCSVCNKKFKRPHHLKEHSRTHTGEKPYQCNRCGEKFQRSHLLMKHKEKHHSIYGKYSMNFSAPADISTVTLNGYLGDRTTPKKTSILPNDGTNVLDCDEPPQRADDSDKGGESGGECVSCEICSKEFPSETTLTIHKRTHPGDRPHQCSNCGKNFALQYLLEVHEKSCT